MFCCCCCCCVLFCLFVFQKLVEIQAMWDSIETFFPFLPPCRGKTVLRSKSLCSCNSHSKTPSPRSCGSLCFSRVVCRRLSPATPLMSLPRTIFPRREAGKCSLFLSVSGDLKGPDLFGHLPGGMGEPFSLLGAACV